MTHRRVDLSPDQYDERWAALAATGEEIHGEVDLVEALLLEHGLTGAVLDAGCGTGRVAVELAARGHAVTGVDLDPALLDAARVKDPAAAVGHRRPRDPRARGRAAARSPRRSPRGT